MNIVETGDPATSYENAMKMSIMHGPIVAISHIVTPRDEHVTKLFYFDGKTHTAFGFAIGEKPEDETREARILGLIMTLQTIWSIDMGSIYEHMKVFGSKEDTEEAFKDQKNIVYHFTAPQEKTFIQVLDSSGMLAFTDSVELLEEDKNITRIVE